jgi:mono/diheme cytochrome c family protein
MDISRTTRWVIGAALLAGVQLAQSQQSDQPASQGGAPHQQPGNSGSQEQETSASATKEHGDDIDVKNVFRNVCSFCHQDYGRKAGKGPQLMNSPRSDEYLFNIIKHGKAGRMAAFGTQFTDDQIKEIVGFIRELEPDKVPPG